jgi:hypothetical protein
MHLNSNIVSGKKKANSDTISPDIYFNLHSIRPFLETNHAFFVLAPAYSVNGCTTPPAYSVTQLICGESVRQSACFSISSFFCRALTYVNSPLLFLTAPRICYNYIVSNGFSEGGSPFRSDLPAYEKYEFAVIFPNFVPFIFVLFGKKQES